MFECFSAFMLLSPKPDTCAGSNLQNMSGCVVIKILPRPHQKPHESSEKNMITLVYFINPFPNLLMFTFRLQLILRMRQRTESTSLHTHSKQDKIFSSALFCLFYLNMFKDLQARVVTRCRFRGREDHISHERLCCKDQNQNTTHCLKRKYYLLLQGPCLCVTGHCHQKWRGRQRVKRISTAQTRAVAFPFRAMKGDGKEEALRFSLPAATVATCAVCACWAESVVNAKSLESLGNRFI